MTWTSQYSAIDRFVHRAAFASTGLQKVIADMEDTLFKSEFGAIDCAQPVFITSLPRAGTTLLLDLLSELPAFATHTYRNMPFLMCPLLWDRVTRGFRRQGALQERAHGDGMLIDYDSPEAFEEALWQAWWPEKYKASKIALWQADEEDEEFRTFFFNHLKKVIALSQTTRGPEAKRYISKNNANIARIPALTAMFPSSKIIIPVREPVSHVRSLHHQHTRFLQAHAEDSFARDYMRAIGHLDFGVNFVPIAFPGMDARREDDKDAAFWLEYWIAAYDALQKMTDRRIAFVCYESLCDKPLPSLAAVAQAIGETPDQKIAELAQRVTNPRRAEHELTGVSKHRLDRSLEIYETLKSRAINQ